MKHLFLFAVFFSFSTQFFAQNGKVVIVEDPRINLLIQKQIVTNPPSNVPQMVGYRVQVFFDADRKAVEEARTKIANENLGEELYFQFNAPNYILKAGDFRTKLEAEAYQEKIQSLYPASFIIKELTNLPKIN